MYSNTVAKNSILDVWQFGTRSLLQVFENDKNDAQLTVSKVSIE